MVLAEVPLWVVHSNATATTTTTSVAAANGDKVHYGSSKKEEYKEQRAMDSLMLLAEGLGGAQKCAIYSIDIHPNGQKFATGGGDGTVRIWNSGALFPNGGNQSTTGRSSKYEESGNYVSSGESSAADEKSQSSDGSAGSGELAPPSDGSETEQIHDLSNVVRRKKDGSLTLQTPVLSPTKTSSSPSPHHHHHHQKHGSHRLLCTLSAHTGSSVLALRFSTNGQYLASAGDDSVVCVYAPSGGSGGNLDHNSVEHWTRVKLCRGHALDVVGLAWAPDDSHLVSCSLDSNTPIIVWKLTDLANNLRPTHSNVLCNPYKILGRAVHTSTVKGVTFDPAGTYLASSGDDPSVCVWRAHDDWGLEKRIDANSGIFRRWKENDSQTLSSQSLFRRLSWSTDGAYICSTNAVVKNKHVASTISREGWAVSSPESTASGAANLVGHKQPVVSCRHCPYLLDAREGSGEGDEEEPEYATLLALGDKRGFVTVWSTRRSRPVFKIQCSETRCTVTDMAWGRVNKDIMLLVSLLDGQVVALRFGVPDELGKLLKPAEQARVFQLRYGIDLDDTSMGRRRLFVGENSGPKLIENALQYSLEDEDEDDGARRMEESSEDEQNSSTKPPSGAELKAIQSETVMKGGKKRVQPLLVGGDKIRKRPRMENGGPPSGEIPVKKKKVDTLEGAMELAEKASAGAEAVATQKPTGKVQEEAAAEGSTPAHREPVAGTVQGQPQIMVGAPSTTSPIPHSTNRIHSVDLPVGESTSSPLEDGVSFVADCTNSIQIPQGSSGSAVPCTVLTISRSGKTLWKDQIPGTSCSAISASKNFLAVGTSDGCVQLYGTSPTIGWSSGTAFRSHPPFVFGSPIVVIHLHDKNTSEADQTTLTEILVVSADGTFGVYSLVPALKKVYKGSIMPPMSHMLLSADLSTEIYLPKLARINLTETDRLLLVLTLHSSQVRGAGDDNRGLGNSPPYVGAGGSLQAFVYDRLSDLWMRVADSRFVLSDFYSTIPTLPKSKKHVSGELSKLDDCVRMGAISSTLKTFRRGRAHIAGHADAAFNQTGDGINDLSTRSHCEDRIACALALGSAAEFEFWFAMYVRTLAMSGNETSLRLVVDMLIGKGEVEGNDKQQFAWWLSEGPMVLSFDRIQLIKSIVIPEMSKNRALQRVTNEISVEIDSISHERSEKITTPSAEA